MDIFINCLFKGLHKKYGIHENPRNSEFMLLCVCGNVCIGRLINVYLDFKLTSYYFCEIYLWVLTWGVNLGNRQKTQFWPNLKNFWLFFQNPLLWHLMDFQSRPQRFQLCRSLHNITSKNELLGLSVGGKALQPFLQRSIISYQGPTFVGLMTSDNL